LLRCGDCGSARTVEISGTEIDQPVVDRELYEGGFYSRPPVWLDRLIEPLRRIADRGRLARIGLIRPGSRVLEYGAGDGRLLECLAAREAEVTGVEPSSAARERAAERGVVLESSLEGVTARADRFDRIICWHVLEHLGNPAVEIERLAELLEPDGRAIVSVPNLGSWQARLGGDYWFGQDVPRHLTHFTPAGIRSISDQAGLSVETMHTWSLEQNPFGMWQTLTSRASGSRDVIFRLIKWQSLGDTAGARLASSLGLVLALPLFLLAIPLEWLASAFGRGGTITVTLRRQGAGEGGS
jgi:2-polyprenyl-3-methyl-5-hydroxy-6-metoxy-1,4-benzoquinol methylase